jgi:lysophospholipase L1-like esterase
MALRVAKTVSRAAATGLAAGVATVAGQAVYVGRRDLPQHPDLDASGPVGTRGHPTLDVVVVGDSSCTGPGLHRADDIWIRQLLARFDRHRFAVDSFAVGGAQTADAIADQLPRATSRRRHVAVVSIGGNDALHGRNPLGVESRLGRIIDALLDRVEAVVLAGVGDIGTAPRIPFPLSATATAASRGADLIHRRVARTRPLVFKAPMWELTTEAFRARGDVWSSDRYHPNTLGHALWADAVHDAFAAAVEHVGPSSPVAPADDP